MTTTRLATDAEIDEILSWTHAEWGVSSSFDVYQARTRTFLGSRWGRERYRFWLALDDAGTPVAACKLYRLDMAVERVEGYGIGFGAVFTRTEHRGHGHASRMLQQLADAAQADGALAALLFSDIGPEMYTKLGYVDLGIRDGRAPALPGNAPFIPWNGPIPDAWRRRDALAIPRSADYWNYLLVRGECALLAWVPDGSDAEPAGFVAIDPDDEELLWVEEAGLAPGRDAVAFWTDLRTLAAAYDRPEVGCWLPPEARSAGYTGAALTKPLGMAKLLNAKRIPRPVHLWSLDHF